MTNLPAVLADGKVEGAKMRLRKPLRNAIRLIVADGLSIRDAAKASGLTLGGLYIALRKPHVRAYRADVKRAWMESQTERAWLEVAKLSINASSEDVRLKANRTILEAAGELAGDDKDRDRIPRTLINLTRNETHIHQANPTTHRLPGVIEATEYADITDEPLDP